jgi:hypothetical protein
MMANLLLDLLVVSSIMLLGAFVAWTLLGSADWLGIATLAFPLGAGLLTWFLFLLSWSGLRLTRISVIIITLSLLLIALATVIAIRRPRFERNRKFPKTDDHGRIWKISLAILLGLLFALSAFLAIGRSYSSWDAVAIWSIKGYGIAREGTIFAGQDWGAHGLSYPLNIPLLIALFRLISGDLLPGSKLIFPLFYASLILGCFRFWQRRRVPGAIVAIGTLFTASIPILFEHSTVGYANLPLANYLVLGCLFTIDGGLSRDCKIQVIGGLLLGMAAWTRPEGIIFAMIVVMSLFLSFWISKIRGIYLVFWLLPIAVIGSSWLLFLLRYGGQSQVVAGVSALLRSVLENKFPWGLFPKVFRSLIRHLFTIRAWGFLYPAVILSTFTNYRKLNGNKYPDVFALMAVILAAAIAMVLFYVSVAFVMNLDIWIPTSMDRMFLPVGALVIVWTVLLAGVPNQIPSALEPSPEQTSLTRRVDPH